jgi:hypothetical protein
VQNERHRRVWITSNLQFGFANHLEVGDLQILQISLIEAILLPGYNIGDFSIPLQLASSFLAESDAPLNSVARAARRQRCRLTFRSPYKSC